MGPVGLGKYLKQSLANYSFITGTPDQVSSLASRKINEACKGK